MEMLIYFNNEVKVTVGDEVSTTTSDFAYDNYYGCFVDSEHLNMCARVDVEYTHSDYSEYNPRSCHNGGDYGYDYYVVTKVYEVCEL